MTVDFVFHSLQNLFFYNRLLFKSVCYNMYIGLLYFKKSPKSEMMKLDWSMTPLTRYIEREPQNKSIDNICKYFRISRYRLCTMLK